MQTTPGQRGLYRPEYEHDSCGVAFVVDMYGRKSRDIVEKAIAALVNLEHRAPWAPRPTPVTARAC